jgi:hypothetical protein
MDILIERKKEYTIQLVNILSPFIFEGFNSIYKEAETKFPKCVLKNFQLFLRDIKKWKQSRIDNETERILERSNSRFLLPDLFRAVLKSSIHLLIAKESDYEPDSSLYDNISLQSFIYNVYLECARKFWNDPYSFSISKLTSKEIKNNQRKIMDYIKDAIENAIRSILPMSFILKTYLEDKRKKEIIKYDNKNNSSIENLSKLSDKEPINHIGGNQLNLNEINQVQANDDKFFPVNNNFVKQNNYDNNVEKYKNLSNENFKNYSRNDTRNDTRNDSRNDSRNDTRNDSRNDTRNDTRNDSRNDTRNDSRNDTRNDSRNDTRNDSRNDTRNVSKMIGGNINENKLDINDKILNIIDNQNIKLSSSKKNNIRSESSIIKNLKTDTRPDNHFIKNEEMDSKIKNILEKDLGDSIKSSISYKAEKNTENYNEVFSNSDMPNKINNLNGGDVSKNIENSSRDNNLKKQNESSKLYSPKKTENSTNNHDTNLSNIDVKDTAEKLNIKNKHKFFSNYLNL